jgi:NTP pyrophosphatase (non-canonical NTP hydrolase)
MKTEDIDGYRPSKWVPCTDLRTLAALGKLAEECGELSAIIARCIIQGPDGKNPETSEINCNDLEKEIADVVGLSRLVARHFQMDPARIAERAEKKFRMKEEWLEMLR